MRKLPPLYVVFGAEYRVLTACTDDTVVRQLPRAGAPTVREKMQLYVYEPAVPRCKTCKAFGDYGENVCRNTDPREWREEDDYCSQHSELHK